jgi:hypothetical protein
LKVHCLIRSQPWYRREAFITGLRMAGHQVNGHMPSHLTSDTLVVMWNRYGENHELANRVEAAGGTVLVAENGYLGRGGTTPKFDVHGGVEPGHHYALAIGGHNGSGHWPQGGPERFAALGIELQPWRTEGEHILICPSRNFGRPDMLMPTFWVEQTVKMIRKFTKMPVRIREHPGNSRPKRDLAEDLVGAAAVVIWASSSGLHALVQGIPVVACASRWIANAASYSEIGEFFNLYEDEGELGRRTKWRQIAFERLAWAQWTVDEIASGEPFRRLLEHKAAA